MGRLPWWGRSTYPPMHGPNRATKRRTRTSNASERSGNWCNFIPELPAGSTDAPEFSGSGDARGGRAVQKPVDIVRWRRQPQRAGQSWSLTMKLLRRQVLLLAAGAATLSVASRTAGAQTYPSRPITMVVPFAAGGPADVVGRIIAERMRASLGQPIIIENVTGAAGTIGTGRVARASPDGYTLSIGPGSSTHVINGAIYTLPYDVLNDFEPIGLLSNIPHLIVANKAVPADDLKGLIGWLKANPDSASQGTSGVGSVGHIVGVFFQKETGTRFH